MRYVRIALALILITSILAACGGGSGSSAPSGSAAATAAPAAAAPTTAAAAPTTAAAAAEATTAPAAAATSAPFATSTPAAAAPTAPAAGQPISAGDITFSTPTTYTQSAGIFSLAPPSNWITEDRSNDNAAQVAFHDPTGQATFLAHVIAGPPERTPNALVTDLDGYLKQTLGVDDLKLSGGAQATDGRLPVQFTYTGMRGGKPVPYTGGGYVAQRGNLISFIVYAAPTDQFASVRSDLETIASSYALAPNAQLK